MKDEAIIPGSRGLVDFIEDQKALCTVALDQGFGNLARSRGAPG